jgi:transposase InsO family protein
MLPCTFLGMHMEIQLHKNARTTPATRREMQETDLSERKLAEKFNVSRGTARKWKNRDSVEDKSHRPKHIKSSLSELQQSIIVMIRTTLLLPIDDLLAIAREFVIPDLSRSALDRCLRRHGVSNLKTLLPKDDKEPTPKKSFKDYEPGFVHIDVKYLPQMSDEEQRKYLFVAIDRATRWVYLEILNDKSAISSTGFLNRLIKKSPIKITKILTDNGKEFTDRFCATGERKPTGDHLFDQSCKAHGIEHRLIKPRTPQTNGMVERFNGRIADVLKSTTFHSTDHLATTLQRYERIYNQHVPQRNLGHISPIQALKNWQEKRPELFVKLVYNLPGLDRYESQGTVPRYW